MELFAHGRKAQIERESPLANRLRPRTLEEFVGQDHIVGPGRLLRRAIQADQLSSLIFYGPPGTGKTTLAMIIANTTESHFITINAVLAGVAQIREAISEAIERRNLYGQRTTLFVDEVHRWNKAQQDALLPHVENGTVILIGATTENPYFEVNKALVSRSRIFQLKPLETEDLFEIARQALEDPERGYGKLNVHIDQEALDHLVDVANGDARGVLNALELAVETTAADEEGVIVVDLAVAEESIQRRAVLYDKEGDVHYDTISAFIKSLRGSDPDAALYWMAKMVYAGEDPRFIFRRMAILASEDVGLADPNAVTVVDSCWSLYERVGMPEGRFHLAEAALYLATCPKSNTALSFFDALAAVEQEKEPEVPTHLRDASRDSEGFGHGAGYLYPHSYRDHWVAQQYLPASLQGKFFYEPSDVGYENEIRLRVTRYREAQLAAMDELNVEIPEILTTRQANRAADRWLQRTIANSGRNLAWLRDQLFDLAVIQRHHLVLVVSSGSGLLVWEAVRRAGEGGVYTLVKDAGAGEALRQQAQRLPEVERPVVLIGEAAEMNHLLDLREESQVLFDRIVGRNFLSIRDNQQAALRVLSKKLRSDGLLCFVQAIPGRAQRLYRLVDWTLTPDGLMEKVEAAEESIYLNNDDPMVNWDVQDLQEAILRAGLRTPEVKTEIQTTQRRITADQLDRWLLRADEAEVGDRLPYRACLVAAGLAESEIEAVSELYREQLTDRLVDWQSTHVFMVTGI